MNGLKISIILVMLAGIITLQACGSKSKDKFVWGTGSGTGSGTGTLTDTYSIVDTGQVKCYDNGGEISPPSPGAPFHGQDAQCQGNQPSYTDNGDGTITDNVTGMMWVKARGVKTTWDDAVSGAAGFSLAGHNDWRLPTIKELYSLIDFTGGFHITKADSVPFIETTYFDFEYGNEAAGDRLIDCQDWSATEYVGTTMNADETVFGVNFADGRIKGYPKFEPGSGGTVGHQMFVRYVRGNPDYGINNFVDNGDGTITDRATGLMWQKTDDGNTYCWQAALAYAEGLSLAGHGDWRLPNAKELQSIVDYTRSPSVTGTAAIDPIFGITVMESYFWAGTTHLTGPLNTAGKNAVYVAFGRALGYMERPPGSGTYELIDVHGAGAQRSDPKDDDPANYPYGHGPQGDDIRVFNYVRCVRDAS